MVTRIVKMTFRTDSAETFTAVFERYKKHIRAADGCAHLSLLQDKEHPHIFFTYSHWENETYLEKYRLSSLFSEVWPQTKALFSEPAMAWTLNEMVVPSV
jgi:quinol monooxygenase YgiN